MQNISKKLIVVVVVVIIALVAGGLFWYASVKEKQSQLEAVNQQEVSQANDIPQWEKDALVEREKLGYPALLDGWGLFRSEEYGFEVGYPKEWDGTVQKHGNADSYFSPSGDSNPNILQIFSIDDLIKIKKPGVQKFSTVQDLYNTWYLQIGYPDESGRIVANEKVRAQHIVDGPKMDGEFSLEELQSNNVQKFPDGNYWLTRDGKRIGWFVSQKNGENYDVNVNFLGAKYVYYFSDSFTGAKPYFYDILSQFRIIN